MEDIRGREVFQHDRESLVTNVGVNENDSVVLGSQLIYGYTVKACALAVKDDDSLVVFGQQFFDQIQTSEPTTASDYRYRIHFCPRCFLKISIVRIRGFEFRSSRISILAFFSS